MLERMFKKKVYSKCKAYARLTTTRLETIRKKRNAVEKFLKKDIVDLLSSNLDYNAYGRAEGLLVEQNMSSCYELIEKYIECILDHAKDLYDQGDCPEECKEAIPSLIYAAARFSDLPELRDLRTLFTAKYGASLEPYLSKEFVKKLRKDPPSKEMKIQLLSDLAKEFSIQFDSKALEQKLQSLPPLSVSHEFQEKAKDDAGNNDTEKSNDGSKISNNKGSDEDGSNKRRTLSFNVVPPPYYVTQKNNAENIMVCNNNNNNNTATAVATSEKDSSKPKPRSMRRIKPNPPPYDNGQSIIRRTISDSCDTKTETTTTTSNPVGRSTSLSSHPRLPDYDDISARLAALRRAHNH